MLLRLCFTLLVSLKMYAIATTPASADEQCQVTPGGFSLYQGEGNVYKFGDLKIRLNEQNEDEYSRSIYVDIKAGNNIVNKNYLFRAPKGESKFMMTHLCGRDYRLEFFYCFPSGGTPCYESWFAVTDVTF